MIFVLKQLVELLKESVDSLLVADRLFLGYVSTGLLRKLGTEFCEIFKVYNVSIKLRSGLLVAINLILEILQEVVSGLNIDVHVSNIVINN